MREITRRPSVKGRLNRVRRIWSCPHCTTTSPVEPVCPLLTTHTDMYRYLLDVLRIVMSSAQEPAFVNNLDSLAITVPSFCL